MTVKETYEQIDKAIVAMLTFIDGADYDANEQFTRYPAYNDLALALKALRELTYEVPEVLPEGYVEFALTMMKKAKEIGSIASLDGVSYSVAGKAHWDDTREHNVEVAARALLASVGDE